MSAEYMQAPLPESPESTIKWIFFGPNGLRAGWRLICYVLLVAICLIAGVVLLAIIQRLSGRQASSQTDAFAPQNAIVQELIFFSAFLIPAIVMKFFEKRSLSDYGLPWRSAFGKNFWAGFVWGLVLLSIVMAAIALFHGYGVGSVALAPGEIIKYGLLWLVAFLLVGFAEEFSFRGYTQYTLATGIGFWPAAILLSLGFGSLHLTNKGEGLIGALDVFVIAIFFCLTLKRTGSLWFAIGMHASFDWGETFIYSVPNSGLIAKGHLLNMSMHGSPWITGGTVGPEGSVFSFIFTGIAFLVFAWAYPGRSPSTSATESRAQPTIAAD